MLLVLRWELVEVAFLPGVLAALVEGGFVVAPAVAALHLDDESLA